MSTDESTIPFPVNKLKAETLRSMAKDLGVISGGKKVELLQRLRAISASGWSTPTKRKSDPETVESPPATTKKLRSSRKSPNKSSATVVEPISPTRRYSQRNRGTVSAKVLPQQEHPDKAVGSSPVPNEESLNVQTTPSVFDGYLTSGSTSIFITGDDLLTMVDEVLASAPLTLWKVIPSLAESDPAPSAKADHWLIPANEADKIQNVTAFKEAYTDILEKQRELNTATSVRKEASDGQRKKDGATAQGESTKRWWYEVSVSRNLASGALAVKLVKGTVEGKTIVPIKDAKEEAGTFWLSKPNAAKKDDIDLLENIVKLLL